ncbi:hypothetical protein GCM10022252_09320 [Streptosporangium oxazolinicum]|uniref:WD40 repeat domain-containing protein n=1 Tax=Streptosporangium oxazolinicum TaxID=909287 RepID=A0ABP8AEU8_9ACTN
MTIDELVRQTLREWSAEANVPPGDLAGAALRRRRRNRSRTFAVVAGATAAVIAAAVTAPALVQGALVQGREQLGNDAPAIAVVADPDPSRETAADPDSSPPKTLVAAGEVAAYSYYTWKEEKISADRQVRKLTWNRYDRDRGVYERTPWAWLDVARGGEAAAFLEEIPATRVGVLTGRGAEVRWIALERPASAVRWSPDATRLLLTNYSANPDESYIPVDNSQQGMPQSRIGFTVVDLNDGRSVFRTVAVDPDAGFDHRNDFGWSDDGTLVWESHAVMPVTRKYYDLEGRARPAPSKEAETYQQAGLSPGGTRLAVESPDRSAVVGIQDLSTGRTVPLTPVSGYWIEQSVAWADDERLVVWACEQKGTDDCVGGEFRNRLLLVGLNGGEAVPLSGFRENSQQEDESWVPVFTAR